MDFIKINNRNQIQFFNLEIQVSEENPVRFLDVFPEKLDLNLLGFVVNQLKNEVRPAYKAKLFLKIYLYGYLNGIKSCRRLEKECIGNYNG